MKVCIKIFCVFTAMILGSVVLFETSFANNGQGNKRGLELNVKSIEVEDIPTMMVDEDQQLNLTAIHPNGSELNKVNFTFESEDQEVVTVNNEGMITGQSEGEANINVTTANAVRIVSESIAVTVEQAEDESKSHALNWPEEQIEAYAPQEGGVWYPRMVELDNGDWLVAFDTNEDEGFVNIKVVRSSDEGKTWDSPTTVVNEDIGDAANAQMLELENGDIWLSYRLVEPTDDGYNTYLRVTISSDNGVTWNELPNGQIVEESSSNFTGVWEPHLGYIEDTIAVMYAHDGPSIAGETHYQNILMKTWDGHTWSDPITVVDGVKNLSRDGMPVWTQMENGDYILVYEATDIEDHPFNIRYTTSSDGYNWSQLRKELYTPKGTGKKAGAPYVEKLSDGRLVASFQTDEDSANTGDPFSSMYTIISDDNGETWDHVHHTFPVADDRSANWNSLMKVGGNDIIAATSTNYPKSGIFLRRGTTDTPLDVNLVNNSSFETGNTNGWTTYGNDYPERIIIQGVNAPTDGGGHYVQMTSSDSLGTAYIGQTLHGLSDGKYTMNAYMRSSGNLDSCYMEVKDYGGSVQTIDCPDTLEWTPVTISDIQVTDGEATIGFYASMDSENQWVDIDMVEFILESE